VDLDYGPDSTLHFNESLAVFAVRLRQLIPFDAIAVYLVDGDTLIPEYVSGENHRLFSSLQIPMGQGLSGWVAENRKPILNGNPSVEPGYLNDPNAYSTMRSALAVPLDNGEGHTIGVAALYHEGRDVFTKDHLQLLETVGPKLALFVEQAAPTAESPDQSTIDRLTGLPHGRTAFLHLESEIVRCKRLNTSLAVLVCSVDGLREMNQRLGRIEGDKVLRQIATAIKDTCHDSDYVARLGTHEFVVVIPGMRPEFIQERIAKLAKVAHLGGKQPLTLIVGDAYFPEDGREPEQLIGEADRRMFRAKHQRRASAAAGASDARAWVQ
jgi:diguanylate cyclase (GGDEF)-like protein